MLNLSKCTIEFKPSIYYWRLISLLYLFALWMLLSSSLPLFLQLMIAGLLIYQFFLIYQNPNPAYPFTQLMYSMDEWQLIDNKGKKLFFDKHRLILDTGLFFVIELKGDSMRKLLVFNDQLNPNVYRQLRLMEKLIKNN